MPQIIARVIIDLDEMQAEMAESGSTEYTFHASSGTTVTGNGSAGAVNVAVAFTESELAETERHHILL